MAINAACTFLFTLVTFAVNCRSTNESNCVPVEIARLSHDSIHFDMNSRCFSIDQSSIAHERISFSLVYCLVCFLVCWLPFFVLNNLVNAIVKLSRKSPAWLIPDVTLSLCVWLGYINSFLNPIIYTIFNLEFRKAFAKILSSSCQFTRASLTFF
jgi:hypothetical protein